MQGKRVLSDAWALDTAQKPYAWQRLNPEGDRPSARINLFGDIIDDQLMVCKLKIHECIRIQNERYSALHWPEFGPHPLSFQFASSVILLLWYATASARSDGMFLLCGGRDSSGAPLADAYGLLMHRNGQWEWTLAPGVSPSPRYQHAAVFVGARLHVTGGALRGGRAIEGEAAVAVLDTAAGVWLDRNGLVTSPRTNKGHTEYDPSLELMRRCRHAAASVGSHNHHKPKLNQSNANLYGTTPTPDGRLEHGQKFMEKLAEASAAEAEAVSAVWQAMQAASAVPSDETSVSDDNSQAAETTSDGSDTEADVRLHPRAVVVAKEAVGNLGGMIISTLLRPRNWKAPANRRFFLDSYEVGELCYAAEQIFMHEPTVLQLKAPIKVFGDLHGQFGDLMRLFDEYGFPSTAGDITEKQTNFGWGVANVEALSSLLGYRVGNLPTTYPGLRPTFGSSSQNKGLGCRGEMSEKADSVEEAIPLKRRETCFD
ncbi:Serine/threonine-protein phosphatase BSL1 [Vitis vinifera]|uniref:protein-serine/threonine phosphatase n=1 Tax=Vitis vinifera TaxID=29760 RepID=A0A438CDB0_VITVI|nr:Serine/threonine-protein phosphatase BSL1 [Vitis vinifera]